MSKNHIVIGFGSNLGHSLSNLRFALRELKKISQVLKVSNLYESDAQLKSDAPADWNQPYLNAACLVEVPDFKPADFLRKLKNIEKKMGPRDIEKWSPRKLDLDILYWSKNQKPQFYKTEDLIIPHQEIPFRPFALLPLLEVEPKAQVDKPEWIQDGLRKPFNTQISTKYYWPKLMGIINLTPDSFSDGDKNLTVDKVYNQIESLLDDGAEILDFGAQSTRHQAVQLTADEEWQRLSRFIPTILAHQKKRSFQISLDTFRSEVARKFYEQLPWNYLNDVTWLQDSRMLQLVKETKASVFAMHSLAVPTTQDLVLNENKNPITQLIEWWEIHKKNLMDLGLSSNQLIFDPGIGFGKTHAQCFYILQNLEQFFPLHEDILIGHSRKSFLTLLTDKPASERDSQTAMVTQDLNQAYVQYLRVHDIGSQKTALRMIR